jgi:phosphatidylethanolamine-binding protein (PEBP) family uncharacterized protein
VLNILTKNLFFPPGLNSFPTNGSGGLFTLMAIDPDVPSRNNSIYSEFLQWLVVNIPDEDIERGQSKHTQSVSIYLFLYKAPVFKTMRLKCTLPPLDMIRAVFLMALN